MNIQQTQAMPRTDVLKPQQIEPAVPAAQNQQAQPAVKPTTEDVNKSVQDMQKQLEEMRDTQVSIRFDNEIDRVIIKFAKSDGELIKQIPSQDFVDFQREFVKMTGLLLDKKA